MARMEGGDTVTMEVQTPTGIAAERVDALSNSVGLPAASGLDCDLDCHSQLSIMLYLPS